MHGMAIGIDIGGTHTVFGLVDEKGCLVGKRKVNTDARRGFRCMLDVIESNVNELTDGFAGARSEVRAIGVGMPGRIDANRGICLQASNLHLHDVPVADQVARATGLPCRINNDVKMYVYGEALYGAGMNKEHVLGVTIGTGLSGALIVKGEPYGGYGNEAGEIGHIPVEGNDRPCNCGRIGCLETIVSATGLARSAAQAVREGRRTVLAEYCVDPSLLTAADVSRAYDAGDAAAIDMMHAAGVRLGEVLSVIVPMVAPDVLIVGGGVALAGERLLRPFREELARRVSPSFLTELTLTTAMHNDDAGVIGAAAWAAKRI